jgi:peptidoglycan hydrolase CwlO-like protein
MQDCDIRSENRRLAAQNKMLRTRLAAALLLGHRPPTEAEAGSCGRQGMDRAEPAVEFNVVRGSERPSGTAAPAAPILNSSRLPIPAALLHDHLHVPPHLTPHAHTPVEAINELTAANSRIDKLLSLQSALTRKYERELKARTSLTNQTSTLAEANARAEGRINTLQAEMQHAKQQLHHQQTLTKRARDGGGAGGSGSTPASTSPHRTRGFVMHTVQIKLEKAKDKIGQLEEERDALRTKTTWLAAAYAEARSELGQLDQTFFDELEDLKYALQQSNKLNGALDSALRAAAVRAGVPYQALAPDFGLVLGASFLKSRGKYSGAGAGAGAA